MIYDRFDQSGTQATSVSEDGCCCAASLSVDAACVDGGSDHNAGVLCVHDGTLGDGVPTVRGVLRAAADTGGSTLPLCGCVRADPGYVTPAVVQRIKDAMQEVMEEGSKSPPMVTLAGNVNCSNLFGRTTAASAIAVLHPCIDVGTPPCVSGEQIITVHGSPTVSEKATTSSSSTSSCTVFSSVNVRESAVGALPGALFSDDAPRGAANFSAMAVVGFVLGGALAVSLLGFIAVHSYLLVHGATTIECHQYGRAFPFNQGWRKNFNDVFGDTTKDWLLPTTPARKQRYVLHPAELEHLTADSCFGDSSDQEDDSLL
ncbi:hypothetical protein GQ600_18022 [Phytophthora cactorum]|nr:hypothetical protein GQ600_18022 [Phytophthora cactorum]